MSKTFNEAQREQGRKQWDEARKRDLDERLGIAEQPSDDSGRLAAALLRIEQLEREKAELAKALEQSKIVLDIRNAQVKRMEEQQNGFRPDFLVSGTRFKLNFSSRGNTDVFAGFTKELEGRWVALVPADDDRHLVKGATATEGGEG